MTSYRIGLLLHLLGAFSFVAGAVLAGVAFEAARRRDQARDVALLLGLSRIGALLVLGGGALLLGAGLWLADRIGQTSAAWVVSALALFLVSLVLGAVGGRHPKLARRRASELAQSGAGVDPQLRRLLDDRTSRLANYGSSALIVAIVVLMVWQPGR